MVSGTTQTPGVEGPPAFTPMLPVRDDLFVTALVEIIGKQSETITAQGDQIVQLSRQLAEREAKA